MALRDTITNLTGKATAALTAVVNGISRSDRTMADYMSGNNSKPLWPPVEDEARRLRYERNRLVYEGQHNRTLVGYTITDKGERKPLSGVVSVPGESFNFALDPERPYIVYNLCSRLSDLLAERAFAEGVEYTVPDNAQGSKDLLDKVHRDNQLRLVHLLACCAASWRGDVVYEVYYDAEQKRLGVSLTDPDRCFAECHPLDTTRLVAMNIDQKLTLGDAVFLWRKRHELRGEEGWITNKLYRMEEADDGYHVDFATDEVDLDQHPTTALLKGQEEIATGVKGLLVVHVRNKADDRGGYWGVSDYSYDLLTLQGALNNRVTQRETVQDEHVRPWTYGPQIVNDKGQVVQPAGKYLPVEDATGSAPVGMVTWDAQLSSVADSIKDDRQAFATTAGVDTASLMPREQGGAISGRALRIEQMNTQGAAQAKQAAFETGLRQLYAVITQLAAQPYVDLGAWKPEGGKIEPLLPEQIQIAFNDGLPSMTIEDLEELQLELELGIVAKRDAIMRRYGLTQEEAEEKLEWIREEQRAGQPEAPEVQVASPFSTVIPGAQ